MSSCHLLYYLCSLNSGPVTTNATFNYCEKEKCKYSSITCTVTVVTTSVTLCDQGKCTLVLAPTIVAVTSPNVASLITISTSITTNSEVVPNIITSAFDISALVVGSAAPAASARIF